MSMLGEESALTRKACIGKGFSGLINDLGGHFGFLDTHFQVMLATHNILVVLKPRITQYNI